MKNEKIEQDENIKRIIAAAMAPTPVRKTLINSTPEKNQAVGQKKDEGKKKLSAWVTVVYAIIVIFTFTRWYLMLLITAVWAIVIVNLKDQKKDEVTNSKKR